jgi:hypothetical protein
VEIIYGVIPEYGDDYGDGSGYGHRDGSGYGTGYVSEEYWTACVDVFAARWPDSQRQSLAQYRQMNATIGFWKSDKEGLPSNGGYLSAPVKVGAEHKVNGPLQICTERALHATLIPPKWKGERMWIVALLGEVQWEEDKCASLHRVIIGECE